MTRSFAQNSTRITLHRKGEDRYTKISFPVMHGIYSEIETRDHIFRFNLNHEITRARGKTNEWLNPSEWMKRTVGNDWVYYSTGGYTGVAEAIGEYYLPNLPYPTNSLLGGTPFHEQPVDRIRRHWHEMLAETAENLTDPPEEIRHFMNAVLANTPEILESRAQKLFEISGSRVSVLPPDARHVDYNVIPVNISRGCLYNCRFCRVKSGSHFSVLSEKAVHQQIADLKKFFGKDLVNYNSVFLGEHDALNAPTESILSATRTARHSFGLDTSCMKGCNLFFFGSADSLLGKREADFEALSRLGFHIYINIGLESPDPATLERIGKPLTKEKITRAYRLAERINALYPSIEITFNFVMDDDLPKTHYPSIFDLVKEHGGPNRSKGTVYFSPLRFSRPSKEELYKFYRLKTAIPSPAYLYIIQRL